MTFTIKNCKITVNFLFLAVLAAFLLINNNHIAQSGIFAAVVHESGHLMVMHLFGVKPMRVKFTPFGIDIVKSTNLNQAYWKDVLISLSGPGMNFAVIPIFYFINYEFFYFFIIADFVLAVFNLLPIEPLDGGQALYAVLCMYFSSDRSQKIVSITSFLVLTPIAILGFIIVFKIPGNFFLLILCIYLIFLLLLKNGRYY